jgi:hypothetical protein
LAGTVSGRRCVGRGHPFGTRLPKLAKDQVVVVSSGWAQLGSTGGKRPWATCM